VLKTIGYGLLALLGINIIIGIHEAGHFFACKLFHIETPDFSIGFGPSLVSYQFDTTTFHIRALPLGGYVEIDGMTQASAQPDNFYYRPYYQKAIVTLSGIICNILLGMIIFSVISPRVFRRKIRAIIDTQHGFIGPIGIFSLLMKTAASGSDLYWGFIGVLSVNIAFLNALPLPFLDGGHFVSYTLNAFNQDISLGEVQQALLLAALFFFTIYLIYSMTRRA